MSENAHVIWFIATATMIVAVLTLGTLAAAGLLGRDKSPTTRETTHERGASRGQRTADADAAAGSSAESRR